MFISDRRDGYISRIQNDSRRPRKKLENEQKSAKKAGLAIRHLLRLPTVIGRMSTDTTCNHINRTPNVILTHTRVDLILHLMVDTCIYTRTPNTGASHALMSDTCFIACFSPPRIIKEMSHRRERKRHNERNNHVYQVDKKSNKVTTLHREIQQQNSRIYFSRFSIPRVINLLLII